MFRTTVLAAAALAGLTVGSYQLSAQCGKSNGSGDIEATAQRSCELGDTNCSVTLCSGGVGDQINDICAYGGVWTCAC